MKASRNLHRQSLAEIAASLSTSPTPLYDKADSYFQLRGRRRSHREKISTSRLLLDSCFLCLFPVSDASKKVNKGSLGTMKTAEIQDHKITSLSQGNCKVKREKETPKSINVMTAGMFQISGR